MTTTMVRRFLVGCAALACAGCATARPSGPVSGTDAQQEVQLALGETRSVDGDRVAITFGRVGEDSRCPTGVQCITAGNAVVSLLLQERGDKSKTLQLNTNTNPLIRSVP